MEKWRRVCLRNLALSVRFRMKASENAAPRTNAETPNPKLQTPEKHQAPISNRVLESYRRKVAQICNLPYRRFPIGKLPVCFGCQMNSARRQTGSLRYSRLEICATGFAVFVSCFLINSRATSPQLSSILPTGAQRGTEVELRFGGDRLQDAEEIICYE